LNSRGKEAAALALHRFGFGASRDSIAAIAADPRGALLSDLDRPGAGFLAVKLPSSAAAARAVSDFRAEEQAKSKLAQRAKKEAEATGMASANDAAASTPTMSTPPKPSGPPLPQQIFENEAAARYDAAVGADIGFVERLVWFWSNHFCISADKDVAMVGAYEREAIRAHVLGRFADLLIAVESHPAMLYYLDNVRSMGADSIAGINGDKGINENLAREILELHTLGVRGGYSQADVTSFAKVLTGWTSTDAADPRMAASFSSTSACTSRVSRPCSAGSMPKAVSIRAVPSSPTWRIIRRRRNTSHKSSPATLSPTNRRCRSSPYWQKPLWTATEI
jgi:uncharacterized protein (DUF1800 family)